MAGDEIIGRTLELRTLERIRSSKDPELLAVYGRRRVGKTHLIRNFFEQQEIYFEVTGQKDATMAEQLRNFADAFSERFLRRHRIETPGNWNDALKLLGQEIDAQNASSGKVVIFFDELPWLASRRSGFLQTLDYFWNTWASRRKNIVVIVCGSAASWMINRLVHARGGMHNRITDRIRLLPFSLSETASYLASRRVHLDQKQILELYMATGGVPHYLRQVQRGESAAQAIDRICFTKDGALSDEFNQLYASLFDNSDQYLAVVRALARKRAGLTRTELLDETGLPSGGSTSKVLEALLESGFIASYVPLGKRTRDAVYRLADEYSLFYLTWIEPAPRSVLSSAQGGYWIQCHRGRSWPAWAGFTFEGICQKHAPEIKRALGISGIQTAETGWFHRSRGGSDPGAQIDLLIDRSDGCVNLCKVKFADTKFAITKRYAESLRNKIEVFRGQTATRKTVFLTLITTRGVQKNRHCEELVDSQVTLENLFGR